MRGFHRYGRRGRSFMGPLWMIGLAILFFSGRWWPGILVLVGISMVFSALWRESQPQEYPTPQPQPQPMAPAAPIFIPNPSPAPVSVAPRADVLPGNCPRCGAPVRTAEVKWNGAQAACSYCGSTLPATRS